MNRNTVQEKPEEMLSPPGVLITLQKFSKTHKIDIYVEFLTLEYVKNIQSHKG